MMANARTYEIMTPESVGIPKSSLVLGKHSGRHAFRERIAEMGYTLGDKEINLAFKRFKALHDAAKDLRIQRPKMIGVTVLTIVGSVLSVLDVLPVRLRVARPCRLGLTSNANWN